jgi:F-type H+-transporting ATPase subunit delta
MGQSEHETGLAHIYAHALFDVASQQKLVTEVEEQLLAIEQILRIEPRVLLFLESPTIAVAKKRDVIRGVLKDFHQPVVNFVCLIVDRMRLELLTKIIVAFHDLANMAQGIAEMELTSARTLTPEELAQLKTMLAQKMQRKVEIRERVQPDLLAGFVVKRGDLQYDGSVSRRVQRLMKGMAEAKSGATLWKD